MKINLFILSVCLCCITGCASWYESVTQSKYITEAIASQLSEGQLKHCMAERFVYLGEQRINCLLHGKNPSINAKKENIQSILRKEIIKRHEEWPVAFKQNVLDRKVEAGMEQLEVEWILGFPDKKSTEENREIWFYKRVRFAFDQTGKLTA